MAGFYHVYVRHKQGAMISVRRAPFEKSLSLALSWYRCNTTTWVIFTTKNARTWYARLSKYAVPGGNLFIAKLDMTDRYGWMPKAFWAWVKKMKDTHPNVV